MPPEARLRLTLRELISNPRVGAALGLGFASGLPFNLPQSTLQAWLADSQVSLKTIGWFTLLAMPYTFKFLWAPLLDRFALPVLGRRRGWIMLFQFALALAIAWLGLSSPSGPLGLMALAGGLVTLLSASQDIVIDAYRTDTLRAAERGIGSTATQIGWRAGSLVAGAFALFLSGALGWHGVYLLMAGLMAATAVATYLAPEPEHVVKPPRHLAEAVLEPLKELLARPGTLGLLLLVFLYKFGDAFALVLQSAFLIKGIGFSASEVGAVAKTINVVATLIGTLVGGLLFARLGLLRSLIVFGLLQAVSNLLYSVLAHVGRDLTTMAISVGFDTFAGGMGAAAFGALLMAMCDRRFSAFQFALLSALSAVPRTFLGPLAGHLVEGGPFLGLTFPALGWEKFFVLTTFTGLPAVLLLWWLRDSVRELDREERA
jgi:MFS transporter, PAT family, beta-lactamase induction signal transducer AmpG